MEGKKYSILAVDDMPENLNRVQNALGDLYKLRLVTDGMKALKILETYSPDLILLDIEMPIMDGYETIRKIKENPKLQNIPIAFLTSLSETVNEEIGFTLGAIDYIVKPFKPIILQKRVDLHIRMRRYSANLEEEVASRTAELNRLQDALIRGLAHLAEYRDPETGGHIHRTQHYIRVIATQMATLNKYKEELSPDVIEMFYKCAPLHDIGKVGIKDNVLLKDSKLSDEEYSIMKQHVNFGGETLNGVITDMGSETRFTQIARDIALTHHEKFDGTGYPNKIKGTDIPLVGRLMSVADVYDALISKRPYKEAFSHDKSMKIIKEQVGTSFDPDVVQALLDSESEIKLIAARFKT